MDSRTVGPVHELVWSAHDRSYHNLLCLIIDEADRILQVGFEEEIRQIVKVRRRATRDRWRE